MKFDPGGLYLGILKSRIVFHYSICESLTVYLFEERVTEKEYYIVLTKLTVRWERLHDVIIRIYLIKFTTFLLFYYTPEVFESSRCRTTGIDEHHIIQIGSDFFPKTVIADHNRGFSV